MAEKTLKMQKINGPKERWIYLLFMAFSFVVLFFCTKSSPLYVFNDWFDANAYFTMGKGLANGLVPYRDLFDHKGPLVYLLYAMGYLVDNTGFSGVFLLQVISLFVGMVFAYKTAKLFLKDVRFCALATLALPLTMLAQNLYVQLLDYGGGSPEEFAVPFTAAAIYLLARCCPKEGAVRGKDFYISMLLAGVCASCVFMLKFNLVVMYIGLFVPVYIEHLTQKRFKEVALGALAFIGGFAAAFVPYLAYAFATGSFMDFFSCYIYFNKIYSETFASGVLEILSKGIANAVSFVLQNLVLGLFLLSGLWYVAFGQHGFSVAFRWGIFLGCCFLLGIVSIFPYPYARIPVTCFCLFGYIGVIVLIQRELALRRLAWKLPKASTKRGGIYAAAVVALAVLVVLHNGNVFYLPLRWDNRKDQSICQDRVMELMEMDEQENRTLQEVLALDGGFYTRAGIVPNTKYFYRPNVEYQIYPVVYDTQLAQVLAGNSMYFLVTGPTGRYVPSDAPDMETQIRNALDANYDLVEIIPGTGDQSIYNYHLYRQREYMPRNVGESGLLLATNPVMKTPDGVWEKGMISTMGAAKEAGVLLDGQFITMPAGVYDIEFLFDVCKAPSEVAGRVDVAVTFDIVAEKELFSGSKSVMLEGIAFDDSALVEFRCVVEAGTEAMLSGIRLTRVG